MRIRAFGLFGGVVVCALAAGCPSKAPPGASKPGAEASTRAPGPSSPGAPEAPSAAAAAAPPALIWEAESFDGTSLAHDDRVAVYVDMGDKHVVAFDLHTGTQRWSFAAEEIFASSLTLAGDTVFFSQRSGQLTALAVPDGAPSWSQDIGCSLETPAAVANGVLVAPCVDLDARPLDGYVVAVDTASGKRRWRAATVDGPSAAPALDDETAYFGRPRAAGMDVVAIDLRSGRERWRRSLPHPVQALSVAGTTLVGVGLESYGLDRGDGHVLWTDPLDQRSSFPIEKRVVQRDGLVLRQLDHAVYGLDPATGQRTKTWAMNGRDGAPLSGTVAGFFVDGPTLYVQMGERGAPRQLASFEREAPIVRPLPADLGGVAGDMLLVADGLEGRFGRVQGISLSGRRTGPVVTRKPPPVEPGATEDDCGRRTQLAEGGALVERLASGLGEVGHVSRFGDDLYWARGGDMYRYSQADGKVTALGLKSHPGSIFAVAAEAFYWFECGPGGCSEHGGNQQLVRYDRTSGERRVLAGSLLAPQQVVLDDERIYWAYWVNDMRAGGVRVMSKNGGESSTLYDGDRVNDLLVRGDRIYFVTERSLAVVARTGGKPTVLVDGLHDGRALAADAEHVYVVDRGDPYWASPDSGGLWSVAVAGGTPVALAGPIRWPERLALLGDSVYLLFDDGHLARVPKPGGTLAPVSREDRPRSCLVGVWLSADAKRLYWLRSGMSFMGPPATEGQLWRLTPP
jgi:outer membrane protein assembly factor BamB